MKILLIFFFILTSCSWKWKHESKETTNPLDDAIDKACFYARQIKDPWKLCDKGDCLTFVGLWDAYADESCRDDEGFDIYQHEYTIVNDKKNYETGKWNRYTEPVYFGEDQDNDSRSEISTEGILGALHALWTKKDSSGLKRIKQYGYSNSWIMGEGPTEYTRMYHLYPIISDMVEKYGTIRQSEDAYLDVWDKIKGYRGNVIADYIALKGRVHGSINSIELEMLETLTEKVPGNPHYWALYCLYSEADECGGDQSRALDILNLEEYFPSDKLPDDKKDVFDWSKGPSAILYIYTVGIIRGF
jgi:hypothetical protein